MKEFQTIIEKYVISYKANQSKIERRNTIRQFQEDAAEIAASAGEYKDVTDEVDGQENSIAGFRALLARMETAQNDVKKSLLDDKAACDAELARIEYEKYSYEIQSLLDALLFHVGNRDMIGVERDALEQETQQIETTLHKMALSKQNAQVQELEQEECVLRERLKVLHEGEGQLEPERKALGNALSRHYEQLAAGLARQIEENEKAYQQEAQKQQEFQDRQQWLDDTIIGLITQISTCKERLNGFCRVEDSFNEEFQETFARNIVGEYEPGLLDIKDKQYQKELEEGARNCTAHKKQLDGENAG